MQNDFWTNAYPGPGGGGLGLSLAELLLPLLGLVVVAFVGYGVIRLAVRHGVADAARRGAPGGADDLRQGPRR